MNIKIFQTLILFFFLFSCSSPCDDTNCGDFGICEEGICECEIGAYGDNCDQFYRDDFVGDWDIISQVCDVGNSSNFTYFITPGENFNEIIIKSSVTPNLLLIAKADEGSFIIEDQVIVFGIPVTHSGSGQFLINGDVEFTLVQKADGQPDRTCDNVLRKQ